MTSEKLHVTSGAEGSNRPAQRGPDKASERPRRGGICSQDSRGARSAPPKLDNMVISARTDIDQSPDSRKRRRAYHRLRTGFSFHYGQKLRFLTLTLVEGSANDIHRCFRVFAARVKRLTPNKIKKKDTKGYFTPQLMGRFFGKKEGWNKPIKFEYFSVNVKGDRQHMHILYFGNWLPHAWLKKAWKDITGDSEIVDIRTTKKGVHDEKALTRYVIGQYAIFQDGDIRFQMSQGWTWRGMVRDWKREVKRHTKQVRGQYHVAFKELLEDWRDVVRSKKTTQMTLVVEESK